MNTNFLFTSTKLRLEFRNIATDSGNSVIALKKNLRFIHPQTI